MKKGKLLAASLLVLFTMTGCGGKKLTCTNEIKESGIEMNQKIDVNFKGDKVDSMKISIDVTLPDSLKDQKQTMIDSVKEEVKEAKVTETKNGFKVTGSADAKDLGTDNEAKYDDVKKTLEATGYKCK